MTKPLSSNAVKGDINRAKGDCFGPGEFLYFGVDGYAVGIFAKGEDRGEHQLFELTERIGVAICPTS